MELSKLIVPLLIFAGLGILIFVGYYRSNKQYILRAVKKVRRKQINAVREREYVKIIGKAKHAGEPLIAPLSKRACVYYDVKIEEKRGKHWRTVVDDVLFEDFFVSTGTEHAIVNLKQQAPEHTRMYLVTDHSLTSRTFKDATPEVENYLQLKGTTSIGTFGMNKTMRYTERIIELDEEITVMGIGNWKTYDIPSDGYSDSRILTLTGSKEQQLLVTDEPKAMRRISERL